MPTFDKAIFNKMLERLSMLIDSSPQEEQFTISERAKREFLEEVAKMHNVSIEMRGGTTLTEQSIIVTVPASNDDIALKVIRLKGVLYRKYRGVSLNVRIIEAR